MPKDKFTMTQIMRRCGDPKIGIPHEEVIKSPYALQRHWDEMRWQGKSQYRDGQRGKMGKGVELVLGRDSANLTKEQMEGLLSCKIDYTEKPVQINVADFISFVKSKEGEILQTRKRHMEFTVVVTQKGFKYTPSSTMTARLHEFDTMKRVLEQYNDTGSFKTSEYTNVTVSSSYTLTLIGLYLEQHNSEVVTGKHMSRKQFIMSHGATCKNWTWSWSFVNHDAKVIIFGAWDKDTIGNKSMILDEAWQYDSEGKKKTGYSQSLEHVRLIEDEGYQLKTFTIFHDGDDGIHGKAIIKDFDQVLIDKTLYKSNTKWYAIPTDLTYGDVNQDIIQSDIESEQVEESGRSLSKEGAVIEYYGKRFERDPANRKKAIKIHGLTCKVCNFNFEEIYGERGADFIEVHHRKPIYTFEGQAQTIDPRHDLIPLCSNCHRMIHRRSDNVLTVEQLQEIMRDITQAKNLE